MIHFARRGPRCIAAGAALLFFLAAAAVPDSSRAAASPTPEQLLAAALHARDLRGLSPGGWWDDQPEFDARLDPTLGKSLKFYVVDHVFGKPDSDPSDVDTAVDLYSSAAGAAADFASLAHSDRKNFGALVSGPSLGNRSRYLQSAAKHGADAASTVRFQSGRYLVRITVSGKPAPMHAPALASLAAVVAGRLSRLDAGTLAAPALPKIAQSLPAAGAAFGAILGTTATNGNWWVWTMHGSQYVISPALPALVRSVQPGAYRRYTLAAHPDNVVDVTVMPFSSDAAAMRYFAQSRKESGEAKIRDTALVVMPPRGANMGYSTELRRGRYGISVACSSPFGSVSSSCARAVRTMAQEVMKNL